MTSIFCLDGIKNQFGSNSPQELMGDNSDPELEHEDDDNINPVGEISSISIRKTARVEIFTIDTIKSIVFGHDNDNKKGTVDKIFLSPNSISIDKEKEDKENISSSSLKSSNLSNNSSQIDHPVILETIRENEAPEMMTNVVNPSPLNNANLEKSIILLKFKHFVFNNTLSDDIILKHLEFTYRFLAFSIKNIEEKSSDIVKLDEISLEKPGISHFFISKLKT